MQNLLYAMKHFSLSLSPRGSGEVCILFYAVSLLVGLVEWFSGRVCFCCFFFSLYPVSIKIYQACFHPAWKWNREHCWKVKCSKAVGKALLTLWSRRLWVVPVKKWIYILLYAGLLEFFARKIYSAFQPLLGRQFDFYNARLIEHKYTSSGFWKFPCQIHVIQSQC